MSAEPIQVMITYFSVLSNTISHYQYLGITLLTGTAVILLQSLKRRDRVTISMSCITGVILIAYLLFGLIVYREMVDQYETLLDLKGTSKVLFSSINNYILYQSWIGIAGLISFSFTLFLFILNFNKHKW